VTGTFEWRPDIPSLLAAGDGPEPYTLALLGQLRPLEDWILGSTDAWTPEEAGRVRWIAMELVSNAVASALGSALGAASGLSRAPLLDVLGTSAVWPGPRPLRRPGGSESDRETMGRAIRTNPDAWLDLPLAERFAALGIDPARGWVGLSCLLDPATGSFDLRVTSAMPPLPGDLEEIRCSLRDPDSIRARTAAARGPFLDGDGICHMPSFTGGGGLGLVESARVAAGLGLALDAAPDGDEDGAVTVRLHGRSGDGGKEGGAEWCL